MNEGPHAAARRGLILILSSPSGAGKTTLSKLLLERDPGIELSISVTTRQRRHSEVDHIHYHFIDRGEFERMRKGGKLLEWAEVHGNFYATPRAPVEQALKAGRDILFDIDWQGTQQVREKMSADTASVFILPPSAQELHARLERRAEDSAEVIARRLANAAEEISHWREYDYVLVNTDVGESLQALAVILKAERAARAKVEPAHRDIAAAARFRRDNQAEMAGFIDALLRHLSKI